VSLNIFQEDIIWCVNDIGECPPLVEISLHLDGDSPTEFYVLTEVAKRYQCPQHTRHASNVHNLLTSLAILQNEPIVSHLGLRVLCEISLSRLLRESMRLTNLWCSSIMVAITKLSSQCVEWSFPVFLCYL